MKRHDRFDVLAGAVLLGEATDAERAAFEAHAAECPSCRLDGACGTLVGTALADARDAETWRPSIRDSVRARIADARGSRFRVTVGALGWAVALSLVLNVALANGVGTHFGLAPAPDSAPYVASMHIELESPAPRAPRPLAVARAARVVVAAPRRAPRASASVALRTPAAANGMRLARERPAARGDDAVARVFAGIDVAGTGGARHVAVDPRPSCAPVAPGDAATDGVPRACPPATGSDL